MLSLANKILKIYLEQVLKEWKKKCRNMGLPLNEHILYTLCFADDQIVIAQEYDDMEYMTRKLIEEYNKWGLEVNVDKTEYMCIGGKQKDLVLNNGQQIKHYQEYKYLRMKITHNGTLDGTIRDREIYRGGRQ